MGLLKICVCSLGFLSSGRSSETVRPIGASCIINGGIRDGVSPNCSETTRDIGRGCEVTISELGMAIVDVELFVGWASIMLD